MGSYEKNQMISWLKAEIEKYDTFIVESAECSPVEVILAAAAGTS